jgi:hypothetical protein
MGLVCFSDAFKETMIVTELNDVGFPGKGGIGTLYYDGTKSG